MHAPRSLNSCFNKVSCNYLPRLLRSLPLLTWDLNSNCFSSTLDNAVRDPHTETQQDMLLCCHS
jgi:hypothetical protein